MSEPEILPPDESDSEDAPARGPNLLVLYGLVALALIAAIGLALLIVAPFYHRR